MAQFRNKDYQDRWIFNGHGGMAKVETDAVATVPNDEAEGYAIQPDLWEPVDKVAQAAVRNAAKKAKALEDEQATTETDEQLEDEQLGDADGSAENLKEA